MRFTIFFADDFEENSLVIPQAAIPIDLVDPLVAVADANGSYVSAGIAVATRISITLTANPFDGKIIALRGDLVQVRGGHRILGPNGTILPDRSELQFTGPGVASVSDSVANGRTVVNISGGSGSGANLAAVDFAASDFDGTTLTIPASEIPFSYVTPIVQVTNASGGRVLIDTAVDPTTFAITLTGEPFSGKLILMSN